MPISKKLREHLSLSQKQFAKWIGAGLRTVQHWEQGRNIQRSTEKGLWALLFIAREGLMGKFEKWMKGEKDDRPRNQS